MHTYTYIYIHIHTYIYIYIYTYTHKIDRFESTTFCKDCKHHSDDNDNNDTCTSLSFYLSIYLSIYIYTPIHMTGLDHFFHFLNTLWFGS